ncbi:MAG: hypothetical protein U5J95_09135 [Balneolaceae bacterium]|nr:hypothetical protein [Balneolaceae bacterium]
MMCGKFLKNSGIHLVTFLLLPYLAIAQDDCKIPEDLFANQSENYIFQKKCNSEDLAEMPIYNPENYSHIKIYTPSKKLHFNMPVVGEKNSTKNGQAFSTKFTVGITVFDMPTGQSGMIIVGAST